MQANCLQQIGRRQCCSLPQQACCSSTAVLLRSQPLRVPTSASHLQQQSCAQIHALHRSQLQPASRRRHNIIAAAAAAPAVVPAVSSAVASFPALQGALAPALPYIMAAAAACCAGLVFLVSSVPCHPRTRLCSCCSCLASALLACHAHIWQTSVSAGHGLK
jgi:hypothetical protein